MQWSRYVQSPLYLEMTRKYYLCSDDMRPVIRDRLNLSDTMQVLDVACGSGFFTRLLAEGVTGGKVYGMDFDAGHIQQARLYAEAAGLSDRTEFLTGDACYLPFGDNLFDMVTSHTFFNVARGHETAMREMIRVTKDGGCVASIDNMSLGDQASNAGYYGGAELFRRLQQLETKAWTMYEAICPISSKVLGVSTSDIPRFFALAGLKNVRVYSLGRIFSLSNAAMQENEKREFIWMMHDTSVEKLEIFQGSDKAAEFMTPDECAEYVNLLGRKRDFLLANVGENEIWEWQGGANLLTVGDVVKETN